MVMVRLPTYEFVDHFLNELIDVKCFKLGVGPTKATPDKCELISAPFLWMVFSPQRSLVLLPMAIWWPRRSCLLLFCFSLALKHIPHGC